MQIRSFFATAACLLVGCSSGTLGESRRDASMPNDGSQQVDAGSDAPSLDLGQSSDLGAGMDSGGSADSGTDFGVDTGPPPDFGVGTDGRVFYVAPDGLDSRSVAEAQNIATPWATLLHAVSAAGLVHGDTVYVRGGTYTSRAGNDAGVHFFIQNLSGAPDHPIRLWAYPGERPIFDLSSVEPTEPNPFAMVLDNSTYVHIKGFVVKNLRQISDGSGISRGFLLQHSNHCTIEFVEVFNMGSTGFCLSGSNDNLILNCDSHHNGDGLTVNGDGSSDAWDNADGFSATGGDTSTGNTFEGCRAWLNSDDGWDFFDWAGDLVTLRNCQSFWNGIRPWGTSAMAFTSEDLMTPGNPSLFFGTSPSQRAYQSSGVAGEGFKCGGGTQPGRPTTLAKRYLGCVSFENIGTGFPGNATADHSQQYQFANCIAYHNGNDGFGFAAGWATGIAHHFENSWAFDNLQINPSGADWAYDGLADNVTHDVWMTHYGSVNYGNLNPPITITNADFVSVSSLGMDGARQADGSLPERDFLRLAASSDLLNAGVDVGLPFAGVAPDIGAFESP